MYRFWQQVAKASAQEKAEEKCASRLLGPLYDHPLSRTTVFICTFQGWHLSPQPTERQRIPRHFHLVSGKRRHFLWRLFIKFDDRTCSRDLMPELPTCRPFGKAVNPGTLPREKYCTSFCIYNNAGQLEILGTCFVQPRSLLAQAPASAQKIKIQSHIES